MILSGADNHPPMLDNDPYDSWKSRIELYIKNREHGRMILKLVEHGPLIWLMVEENDVIRTKKYAELSVAEKIQADCDMKATNIILQDSGFAVPIFSPRDDAIACLNKAMAFLTPVSSSRRTYEAQEAGQLLDEEQIAFLADPRIPASQAQIIIPHNATFQTEDLDTYDSDCDDLSTAQAVLMANISN
nr:hypothetical protein [Tanacetum cinerariifolium]